MKIDAHQHYWSIGRDDYGWITPAVPVLYRDFLPEHLQPDLEKHGIDRTIVVQAAPTLAETDYLLSLSDKEASIAGVVGWLDLNDLSFRDHYERFQQHPKFVGFRIMIQDMPDAEAILEPGFIEAVRYFAEQDVPVDLLVASHQLEPLIRLLAEVPGLRGVIDHIAKPRIADGTMEPWKAQMSEIARHPKLCCKLSGMVTEADHKTWQTGDFTAYIRHITDIFGPQRVLFGSDWPVCLLAADYEDVVTIVEKALPEDWTAEQRDLLYGHNAAAFYKLGQSR